MCPRKQAWAVVLYAVKKLNKYEYGLLDLTQR